MTEPVGKIIVTVESEDREYDFADLSVTFESSANEILEAVKPIILEDTGVNILEDGLYTVKKADNSGNIYIFPKSPAGQAMGLVAYSDSNFKYGSKALSVEIKKVENGFLVELNGYKKTKKKDNEGEEYDSYDSVRPLFVYQSLNEAIAEVDGFFKKLEEWIKNDPEKHESAGSAY